MGGLLSQTLNSSASSATRNSMPKGSVNRNGTRDALAGKLLVCAPSNVAVDELVMRLKEGVHTKNRPPHQIKVVRIGRSDRVSPPNLTAKPKRSIKRPSDTFVHLLTAEEWNGYHISKKQG